MKKASLLLAALACAATVFAQNAVKEKSKTADTKTEKKMEMHPDGTTKTTMHHKAAHAPKTTVKAKKTM